MTRKRDVISLYGLRTEVRYCVRCVVSNQRPRITFDEEGVCSACRYAERKRREIDWEKRERELCDLLDKHRRRDGSYDVIVPCSGGKDSAFVAHQLKYRYGMHPLTVTWAPHLYTEIGWRNLQNFIAAGFDNLLATPDGRVHRQLTRLAFEHLGDPFQPFIYGQKAYPMQIATKYKIPLIMFGENGEVEYGGDSKNENSATHDLHEDLIKHYFSSVGPERWAEYGVPREEVRRYMPPDLREMMEVGLECHFFGYYKKWIPQENYYYAVEHTGFQANPEGHSEGTYSKYASLDDQIDGFHFYMSFVKFGIGRATADASHEIRDGHLTREEGVALVRRFDGQFPQRYFKVFLEYTGLTEERFWECVDSWRSPHLWERVNGEWRLRFQVS
ncbi:MAG: N-acetyl sugar amidotransferase [Chloroflexi bacterium]|nr:N-acetyl sugar amidotransferase [Chloroflexota bacterium]